MSRGRREKSTVAVVDFSAAEWQALALAWRLSQRGSRWDSAVFLFNYSVPVLCLRFLCP